MNLLVVKAVASFPKEIIHNYNDDVDDYNGYTNTVRSAWFCIYDY